MTRYLCTSLCTDESDQWDHLEVQICVLAQFELKSSTLATLQATKM